MAEYLKVKDYAQQRQLSAWTVYRLIENGEIESERFGRSIRVVVRKNYIPSTPPKWKGNRNAE